jgi:hypothetical protein
VRSSVFLLLKLGLIGFALALGCDNGRKMGVELALLGFVWVRFGFGGRWQARNWVCFGFVWVRFGFVFRSAEGLVCS